MAVTSYRYPGTVSVDGSGEVFTNPGNVSNVSTPLCTFSWGSGTRTSEHLSATNFGFTASDVPAGSTINGFDFRWSRDEGSTTDNIETKELFMIRSDGTVITGTNMAITGEWPTALSPEDVPAGSTGTNLWGYTEVTAADVIDTHWGIRFQCGTIGSGTTPAGEFVGFQLRIYYTVVTLNTGWMLATSQPSSTPLLVVPYGEL